jgi:dihydrolipoamide dehydrogenase
MKEHYDFLVIGGGPGGTPAAMALSSAGKNVLLVEKGAGLGGTCLFEGCIPSKILRESARRLREIREAADFGLCLPSLDVRVDWSAIQQRKRTILQRRSAVAVKHVHQIPSLDFVSGEASFEDTTHAHVISHEGEEQTVSFDQAIIATGSTPSRPPIPGITHRVVLDSEVILDIDHIPQRLVVIGAGPIGVELGQVFNTFGSDVTILEAESGILGPVDRELADRLEKQIIADGIDVVTNCQIERLSNTGNDVFVIYKDEAGYSHHHLADTVLLVTGRHPNLEGLGLENTGVQHDRHDVKVNTAMQTTEPNIYAVGDVVGQPMFAHWATAQALALVRNLLGQPVPFPDRNTNSAVIFSEPEIGMVGMTEAQAQESGIDFDVARYDYIQDARAQIAGRDDGLLKIIYERDSHRVIGVHALVEGADDLMGEAALAVKAGVPLEEVAGAIHPHPTLTESFGFAARAAMAAKKLS